MVDEDKYQSALAACSRLAGQEYDFVSEVFSECDVTIDGLKAEYTRAIAAAGRAFSQRADASRSLAPLLKDLERLYGDLRRQRERNLTKQSRNLAFFNVMLFGRTMAGKSTIREAITCGDGSTIGKGAQRTTQDVREYEWRKLRIIDTPGFGAYGGSEDTLLARETLERCDLVLFLLNSDSIQESTFNELDYIRSLNKPFLFVLNVKKDLTNEGNRRRALKDPDKYIYRREDIEGHTERLRHLAERAGMRTDAARVLPIHAQAAFLATRSTGEEAARLREISHLDDLMSAIVGEVSLNGPVRRIETFLGSALNHVHEQDTVLVEQRKQLEKMLTEYEESLVKLVALKAKMVRDVPRQLDAQVDKAFQPLLDSIPQFVDTHIESSRAGQAWTAHAERFDVQGAISESSGRTAKLVVEELQALEKDLADSLKLGHRIDLARSVSHFDATDYKRISGWGAAVVGALSTVAFLNSWNPLGWGLAAAGLLFGLVSFLFDSRTKKLNEAKRSQRAALTDSVMQNRQAAKRAMRDWFETDLHRGVMLVAEQRMQYACASIASIRDAISGGEQALATIRERVNTRLLNQVARVVSGRHMTLPALRRVVRVPGYACYFVPRQRFRDRALLEAMSTALRERIVAIDDQSPEQMLAYFYRGLVEGLETLPDGTIELKVKPENMGKVVGKEGRRIKMAAAISNRKISTSEVGINARTRVQPLPVAH